MNERQKKILNHCYESRVLTYSEFIFISLCLDELNLISCKKNAKNRIEYFVYELKLIKQIEKDLSVLILDYLNTEEKSFKYVFCVFDSYLKDIRAGRWGDNIDIETKKITFKSILKNFKAYRAIKYDSVIKKIHSTTLKD